MRTGIWIFKLHQLVDQGVCLLKANGSIPFYRSFTRHCGKFADKGVDRLFLSVFG